VIVTVVGAAPVHSSVADEAEGEPPTYPPDPKANEAVPAPPRPVLAVDILVVLVQEIPSYNSVAPV
jgi:hypothetical protein